MCCCLSFMERKKGNKKYITQVLFAECAFLEVQSSFPLSPRHIHRERGAGGRERDYITDFAPKLLSKHG